MIEPIDVNALHLRIHAALDMDPIIKNHGLRPAETRLVTVATQIIVEEFNAKLEEIKRVCLHPPETDSEFQSRIRRTGISLGACALVNELAGVELDDQAKLYGLERLGWRR